MITTSMNMILSAIVLCSSAIAGCRSAHGYPHSDSMLVPKFVPGPPTMVYKTSSMYDNNVIVLLNDDRTQVVSYPDPADIRGASGYPIPLRLANGYLLDQRGINKNAAVLTITYQEYARLERAPSRSELFAMILDSNPLIELCDCGTRTAFTSVESQLNALIQNNVLRSTCRVVK